MSEATELTQQERIIYDRLRRELFSKLARQVKTRRFILKSETRRIATVTLSKRKTLVKAYGKSRIAKFKVAPACEPFEIIGQRYGREGYLFVIAYGIATQRNWQATRGQVRRSMYRLINLLTTAEKESVTAFLIDACAYHGCEVPSAESLMADRYILELTYRLRHRPYRSRRFLAWKNALAAGINAFREAIRSDKPAPPACAD